MLVDSQTSNKKSVRISEHKKTSSRFGELPEHIHWAQIKSPTSQKSG